MAEAPSNVSDQENQETEENITSTEKQTKKSKKKKKEKKGGGVENGNQVLTTKKLNEILANLSIQDQPKSHEFWDTQPVPKIGKYDEYRDDGGYYHHKMRRSLRQDLLNQTRIASELIRSLYLISSTGTTWTSWMMPR
jgi:hypothetical protein